jgi:hypothetical protein
MESLGLEISENSPEKLGITFRKWLIALKTYFYNINSGEVIFPAELRLRDDI